MADSYLAFAQAVLQARARPLSAQEILSDARRFDLLPDHLSGETMQKTLQARLAEDIFRRRNKSVFYRTAIGTYFLRSFANDRTLPPKSRQEYKPAGRRQPTPTGRVLFLKIRTAADVASLVPQEDLGIKSSRTSYHDLETRDATSFSVLTFTVIRFRDCCLLHRVGDYSVFREEIGYRTVGFRRFVDEFDTDLFSNDPIGVELSARREVSRIVGARPSFWLPGTVFRNVGVIVEPVDRAALFVVEATLPPDQEPPPIGRRLGVKAPGWELLRKIDHMAIDSKSTLALHALGAA